MTAASLFLAWWGSGYTIMIWGEMRFQQELNCMYPLVTEPIHLGFEEHLLAILLGLLIGPFAFVLETLDQQRWKKQ